MKKTKIKAYGKINLYFELVSKRNDGFHNIKSIMQNIDLYDEITIQETDRGINIETNLKDIPKDQENTVYKTVEIIKERYGIKKGLNIYLKKFIPHSAGLGGGSSDSAAVIQALNDIWKLNMNEKEQHNIASKIGTDVHFFLEGGTVFVNGKGEITKKIKDFKWQNILLVKPQINLSTPFVYSNVRQEDLSNDKNSEILEIYNNKSKNDIITYFKNDLEKIVLKKEKEIKKIKKTMLQNNARLSLMSGSGSSVFGLFDNKSQMYECKEIMEKIYEKIFAVETIEKGFDYER